MLEWMQPPPGMEGQDVNFSEMLQEMLPKKKKRRTVHLHEARRILVDEELKKLVDMDDVVNEALDRVENHGIIFIDEIDKIAGERNTAGPDVSREGVQRDLLPIVEGSTVQTRYGYVRTDHVLFIAAGAFHVSKPSDLIPELQGRFPIRVELSPLGEADFVRIMTEPENALTKQYAALCQVEGATLELHPGRHPGDRPDRGQGERAHGEHRRPPAAHRHDHAARGRCCSSSPTIPPSRSCSTPRPCGPASRRSSTTRTCGATSCEEPGGARSATSACSRSRPPTSTSWAT